VAEAVRRPTRFSDLVEICNGDEAGVRAVVDAFRAPGCNFLAPALDPANPRPLVAATIIDISHESLIRQWKQLSEWLEAEARAVRQWRRLMDRCEDGHPMHPAELASMQAWLNEQKPNAAWARRYGGDVHAVTKFIESSERKRRRFAPVILPFFSFAVLCGAILVSAGIFTAVLHISEFPWYSGAIIGSATIAITCAFGLWYYADLGAVRASLAGLAIVVLGSAAGIGMSIPLMSHGLSTWSAAYWWNVTLIAPVVATVMAIFEPRFRDLSAWVLSVAAYVVPVHIVTSASTSLQEQGLVLLFAWQLFCVTIGLQLRRVGHDNAGQRAIFTALRFGLLGLAVFYLEGVWLGGLKLLAFGSDQRSWPIDLGADSLALAITLAFGLRRYRALALRAAAQAGAVIFVLEFVTRTAFTNILLWRGVAEPQAVLWAAAILAAPCALVGLAAFERGFRSTSVWLPLAALCVVPYTGLAWLHGSGLVTIDEPVQGLVILCIAFVWIAAVGYRMLRPLGDGSSRDLRVDVPRANDPALASMRP
jgi:hypothetical protein